MEITKKMIEEELGREINDFKLESYEFKDGIHNLSVKIAPKVRTEFITVNINVFQTGHNFENNEFI